MIPVSGVSITPLLLYFLSRQPSCLPSLMVDEGVECEQEVVSTPTLGILHNGRWVPECWVRHWNVCAHGNKILGNWIVSDNEWCNQDLLQ